MKKIILAVAVVAAATSFGSTASFAKGKKKVAKCTAGTMTTGKPNQYGWGQVSGCGADGKMYAMPAFCYTASGVCPK